MKLFGLLVAGVAASERGSSDPSEEQGNLRAPIIPCTAGTSVGIDVNGDPDASNTDHCYPTKTSAFVASCNNPTSNVAEMTISFEKNYFDANVNLNTFTLNAAGTHYEHVVGFGGQNTRTSTNGADVELFFSLQDHGISATTQGQQIFLSSRKDVEFACAYSLATQTVSTNVDVAGTDIIISRAARGNLVFEMTGAASSTIGDRHSFSIVPTTPNAVFFNAKNCKVQSKDLSQSYGLIYDDGQGAQCTDVPVDVQLDSSGWSTMTQQDYSYTAFKFSLPATRQSTAIEEQIISCDIDLTMTVNSSYMPSTCAVNPQNFCIDLVTGSQSFASYANGVIGYEVFDANGNSDFTYAETFMTFGATQSTCHNSISKITVNNHNGDAWAGQLRVYNKATGANLAYTCPSCLQSDSSSGDWIIDTTASGNSWANECINSCDLIIQ